MQLLDVDDAGHQHGPTSSQGVSAAGTSDGYLREIASKAYRGGYGVIVLADHGQHTIERDDGSRGGWHGTDSDEDVYVPLVWCAPEELKLALGL